MGTQVQNSQNDYSNNTTLASRALGLKEVKDYCILHLVLNIYEPQRHLEKKGSQRKQKYIQYPKQAKQSLQSGQNPCTMEVSHNKAATAIQLRIIPEPQWSEGLQNHLNYFSHEKSYSPMNNELLLILQWKVKFLNIPAKIQQEREKNAL